MAERRFQSREVVANGVRFTALEAGSGPLALCLHGFPDSAHSWRFLLGPLADAGFHAVAPFMRGYAPTEVPEDGCFTIGALVADALALHEVLEGDERAVLIGHDWGAEAAYGAAVFEPDRWRRLVTLAVPPEALYPVLFSDYDQLKRFFYMGAFLFPGADELFAADDMALLSRMWGDWSPGWDARESIEHMKASLREPANLAAALGYYRAALGLPAASCNRYEAEQEALSRTAAQPTLYMHGDQDGCIPAQLVRDAPAHLSPDSRMAVVEGAGHFLHVEKPAEVNEQILAWIAA